MATAVAFRGLLMVLVYHDLRHLSLPRAHAPARTLKRGRPPKGPPRSVSHPVAGVLEHLAGELLLLLPLELVEALEERLLLGGPRLLGGAVGVEAQLDHLVALEVVLAIHLLDNREGVHPDVVPHAVEDVGQGLELGFGELGGGFLGHGGSLPHHPRSFTPRGCRRRRRAPRPTPPSGMPRTGTHRDP